MSWVDKQLTIARLGLREIKAPASEVASLVWAHMVEVSSYIFLVGGVVSQYKPTVRHSNSYSRRQGWGSRAECMFITAPLIQTHFPCDLFWHQCQLMTHRQCLSGVSGAICERGR